MTNLLLILRIKVQTEFSKILLIAIYHFHDKSSFYPENQGSDRIQQDFVNCHFHDKSSFYPENQGSDRMQQDFVDSYLQFS